MRITPSTNFKTAAGTRPTSRPPATEPTPIGAAVWVSAFGRGAEPEVPEHPHLHGWQRDQEARRARHLDSCPDHEHQRGDDELASHESEQAADPPDEQAEQGGDNQACEGQSTFGQEPRDLL